MPFTPTPNAAAVFRDYNTDGVPASGNRSPQKLEIRTLLTAYEAALNAIPSNVRNARTSAYTVANSDKGGTISLGGNACYTLTANAASGYDSDFSCRILNEDTARGKLISVSGATAFILWPGQSFDLFSQNNIWHMAPMFQPWAPFTAPVIYIDPALGSDSNDGLAPGSGAAFATIGHAIQVVQGLVDYGRAVSGGLNATIQLAYGTNAAPVTYNESLGVFGPLRATEDFTVQGDPTGTNKAGAIIQAPVNNYTVQTRDLGIISFQNVKLVAQTAGYYCVYATQYSVVDVRGVDVASNATGGHFNCANNGHINILAAYNIASSAATHWGCSEPGSEISIGCVITIPSAVTISNFAIANQLGMISYSGSSFVNSGNVTGTKYSSSFNSMINGGGVVLPGNVAGSTSNGGFFN